MATGSQVFNDFADSFLTIFCLFLIRFVVTIAFFCSFKYYAGTFIKCACVSIPNAIFICTCLAINLYRFARCLNYNYDNKIGNTETLLRHPIYIIQIHGNFLAGSWYLKVFELNTISRQMLLCTCTIVQEWFIMFWSSNPFLLVLRRQWIIIYWS